MKSAGEDVDDKPKIKDEAGKKEGGGATGGDEDEINSDLDDPEDDLDDDDEEAGGDGGDLVIALYEKVGLGRFGDGLSLRANLASIARCNASRTSGR